MAIVLDGTTGITNAGGYTGDGVVFADTTPANTLVTTTGGNVGIGTTSTPVRLSLVDSATLGWPQSATETIPAIFRQTSSAATVVANGYKYSATANGFASGFSSSFAKSAISIGDGSVRFYTDTAAAVAVGTDVTPTERARIDTSGRLLVGTTSSFASNAFIQVNTYQNGAAAVGLATRPSTNVNYDAADFFNSSGSYVGYIACSSSTTSYVTSSDYRLKENVAPMTSALAKVALLKPCNYTWKVDGSSGQGFIAHELQEVVPEAVSGEKDAVNEDGSIKAQGIDTSFLVATLTAAIQEQQAIINALTARVEALEGTQP